MASNLDMSLDDIIRTNKRAKKLNRSSRGFPTGSRRGLGADRRAFSRGAFRTTPYPPRYDPIWQQQEFISNGRTAGEAKLHVSNLEHGVSNEDIKVLFSEVGELKRYSINYDITGRSKGTAEVVYYCETDALGAIKRYNGVELDGRQMKIELVGASLVTPIPVAPSNEGFPRNPNAPFRSDQDNYGARGSVHGRGRGRVRGFARGRGRGRSHGEKKSVDDLDAELEKYHFEAMQIK